MTIIDKACWERGCPCHDIGDEGVEVQLAQPEPWVKTYCGGKPNYTTPVADNATTEIPEHWRTEELPMIKPFELEDKIMSAWSTKEDLELFMRQYLDCEKVMTEDEVANVILGIITIHDLRCNELFETYTKVFKLDKYRE